MEKIKKELAQYLSSITEWKFEIILMLLQKPKKKDWGVLSFPIFSLTKDYKIKAQEICKKINTDKSSFIKQAQSVEGFVNFHFKENFIMEIFTNTHFSTTNKIKDMECEGKKETPIMVIDYSSPNVAKFMNIGHLRATVIGKAIVNLAKEQGFKVISINHLGDWGTQFGKLIVAYKKWGDSQNKTLSHLVDIYVRFHKESEKDKELLNQAREVFKKMENGHKEYLELWKLFVDISIENYNEMWKRLRVHHDIIQGESFYKKDTHEVERQLNEKKLLEESEGAKVVFLDKMPPCLIRKNDGTSTYSSRDLSSIKYRFEQLKADINVYVTGVDHQLHFEQLKAVVRKWKPEWFKKIIHLSFGMYRFPGQGKLSTRKGLTISLSELINQSVKRVLKIIEEKNPSLKNKEEVAEMVGIGALIFNDLMNDRKKNVDFSWERILDFEGDSGPFVQYCHVRCISLMNKGKLKIEESNKDVFINADLKQIEDLEWDLIYKLMEFDSQVLEAFKKFKPHILAIYLLELCRVFSRFYSTYRVLDSRNPNFRLELVRSSQKTIQKGLNLLNIQAPLAM